MKVVILGISGRAGSRLRHELLQRGHQVTGIARDVGAVPAQDGLTLASADVADVERLVPLLRGHDAVISTTRFVGNDAASLIGAVKTAGVPRLLVVGGAGSLEVAPGVALVDTPEFPSAYKDEASAGRDFLNVLRGEQALDWTFLSPSALFEPGQRTGRFRIGKDSLLVDANGGSAISMEDYAIALVDELEKPQHSCQRFTVGY
ncbi:3-beta hydroxysteroid dehydrogenase [Pseudomonas sp. PA15(2017)]|uniref:NAD(P)-dependent oxidoreductase n=1 Tax=Pseudomonas sp. PA15(2017) TaxID=1932111 RepID=UPI00096691B6|nr:NAD(P)-dependent oxidoreductase [Pseudomonas sp. PA15(2017)]OLU23270.1 3-beta hydroxysteroid dehydrogenase [Pseudomonas sp. PA15(2017)]